MSTHPTQHTNTHEVQVLIESVVSGRVTYMLYCKQYCGMYTSIHMYIYIYTHKHKHMDASPASPLTGTYLYCWKHDSDSQKQTKALKHGFPGFSSQVLTLVR